MVIKEVKTDKDGGLDGMVIEINAKEMEVIHGFNVALAAYIKQQESKKELH